MIVKSIELINVKSYKNCKIDLAPSMNLLVGANNSGKSTIIKALLNLQYHSFEINDIRADSSYGKIFTTLIDVTEEENIQMTKDQDEIDVKLHQANLFWRISKRQEAEEYLFANGDLAFKMLPHHRVEIVKRGKADPRLKLFNRFSDSEAEGNFIYPFLSKRKTEHIDYSMNFVQSYKVTDNFRNLASKIQKIGNASHVKNAEFIKCCDEILGFRIGTIPLKNQGSNGVEPGIFVGTKNMIPLRAMGDGVANIVGFIVTILTEDNKLFLIEELENDLHPRALKSLLNLIVEKSGRNQFVVSTHSNIVLKYLGSIAEGKIFFVTWKPFESDEKNLYNIPTSKVIEIDNLPEARIDILDQLGYEFSDYGLYEGYLILEESSAETIIKEILIPYLVPSLIGRIGTIAARGVNDLETRVIDFERLIVYIHKQPVYKNKAWIVADGDEAGKACISKLQTRFNTWGKDHFLNLSNSDFEFYYPKRFRKRVEKVLKSDKRIRQELKRQLLLDVKHWYLTKREQAIKEFSVSANEVVTLLKKIAKDL